MRISTNTIYDLGIGALQTQTSSLVKLQQQIATQRRILTPSDDPVAAARVLEVTQSQTLNTQYGVNADSANSSLGLEDNMLSSVSDLIQSARTKAVNAGNPVLSRSDLQSLATELRGYYQELVGLANSNDGNGQYMFSGYQGATKPFSQDAAGNIVYNGDQGQRLLQISTSRQIAVSDAGSDVFMRIKNGNGTFVTAAGAANTGTGLVGTGTVTNVANWNSVAASKDYSVQFRNLPTSVTGTALGAGEEVGIANPTTWNALGKNATVTFGAGTYTVTANSTTTGPIAYSGAPIDIQGTGLSFNFAPAAGSSYSVNGSAVTYDLVDNVSGNSLITGAAPPATGALPRTYTDGQDIAFNNLTVPAVGSDYGVSVSVSGTPGNNDKFSVKASTNESIFTTLDNLINTLETTSVPTGNTKLSNDLATALSNMDNDLNQILTVRASVGARMNEITAVKSNELDLGLQYSQTLSDLQDLDYNQALSDYAKQQVGLQAAQKSFLSIQSLSLFNYIQ